MSRDSRLTAALFESEASHAVASSSFANRLDIADPIDLSGIRQESVEVRSTTQYAGDYNRPVRGVMGGSFRTRSPLPGHGSAITGAVSATTLETLLGYVIGNLNTSTAGTTVNTAGATVTNLPVAAASGDPAGGIISVGTIGDGGGNAQPAVISSHAANAIALLTALPAAPANGAVVYGSAVMHPTETPASMAVQTTRWQLQTANRCINAHGCFPTSLSITGTNPSEHPFVEIDWAVSRFIDSTPTFPTATSVNAFTPAPNAGGSFFVQLRGTSTRQTYTVRSFSINVDLGIEPLFGPGGVGEFQSCVGAVRKKHMVSIEFVVDAGDASSAPTWANRYEDDTNTDWHVLVGFSGAAPGKRVFFYAPNMCFTRERPQQFNDNGVNRERVVLQAKTGAVTTSELTLSSYRLALG